MGTHPIFESDFDCLTDRFATITLHHGKLDDQFGSITRQN